MSDRPKRYNKTNLRICAICCVCYCVIDATTCTTLATLRSHTLDTRIHHTITLCVPRCVRADDIYTHFKEDEMKKRKKLVHEIVSKSTIGLTHKRAKPVTVSYLFLLICELCV